MNHLDQGLLSPPPFAVYEDDEFTIDMTQIVPDERVRDEVVDAIGWQITHTLVGTSASAGITVINGTDHNLLITQTTPICPSLRVAFTVQDEPPRRWINLRRAALRDQNGSAG